MKIAYFYKAIAIPQVYQIHERMFINETAGVSSPLTIRLPLNCKTTLQFRFQCQTN